MFTHVFHSTLLSTLIELIEKLPLFIFKYQVKLKVPSGVTKTYNYQAPWFFKEAMTLTIIGCLISWQAATGYLKLTAFLDCFLCIKKKKQPYRK